MNYRFIVKSLGALFVIEAVFMLPVLFVSISYNERDAPAFLLSIAILTAVSIIMNLFKPKKADIYLRDGFALVGLGWLLCALFGAMPYYFSGAASAVDAIFESVTGFSTTSSSILRDVESLPKGLTLWQALTNWMGGMGVLVLMIAIMPSVKANSIHIMHAEAPGPYIDKFTPRIGSVAKTLYTIYVLFTAMEVLLLKIGGMPLFEAIVHSLSTVSTGGFSNRNLSIGAYNSVYIETVITVFMLLCGVNLSLYRIAWQGKIKTALKDAELHLFFLIIIISILLITGNLVIENKEPLNESIRHAVFQVSSMMTSTCFSSVDFNNWPLFSKAILIFNMFIGGCAGSTAGGLKCIRILLLLKVIRNDLIKIYHPNVVHAVRLNGKPVDEELLSGVKTYFIIYIFVIAFSTLIVSLNGFDIITSFSACLSAVGNMGPGFGMIGPRGHYADFSVMSKYIISVCMLLGRLEIYPILLLCIPSFWRRNR